MQHAKQLGLVKWVVTTVAKANASGADGSQVLGRSKHPEPARGRGILKAGAVDRGPKREGKKMAWSQQVAWSQPLSM